ncbi:uncharacterized protein BCR38DRAFT_407993 [Pseudomassariella vexata]|uniref:Uncharacterized protein n=1 Tax=Pseudomassariella vexata TaxID=1141098 RepID=A0A1Y2E3A7_9PEZI|nr:uncharacterized protein BCR38DRAFT_407993 [Pseudomassariella vexata]ORY66012.1 hypothetical protein BCR38DRAFT_407993 [Pseudomassariella vexata]
MIRAITALALVALVRGAPTPVSEDGNTLEERQWTIGDPWSGFWPPPPSPTAGGMNPPKEKRQGNVIIIGPPLTGGMKPPKGRRQDNSISVGPPVVVGGLNPPRERRQDGITIGGGDSTLKAKITALELQYEALIHAFGAHPPEPVEKQLKAIEAELLKYGIKIIRSPDGTTTTFTPGKVKREEASPLGAGNYGEAGFDLAGLEKTLESLMQQYGSNPPHDVFIVEEKIKHILLAYGIIIIKAPDGTTTTIYPSTKRAAATYDIEALASILEIQVQAYDGAIPPMADWLVLQDIAAVLESYDFLILPGTTTVVGPRTKQRRGTIQLGDSVNTVALQALLAMLEATYGLAPPRDIFLIEQSIATILYAQGISVPGWISPDPTVPGGVLIPGPYIPGGGITPDPTIPGGKITPDPYYPGGAIIPDPTVPGGAIHPSDRKRDESDAGLLDALTELEAQYGTYGSGKIPEPVFIVMQNIATILQADGVVVPEWPNLGGSTTIEPSD